MGGDAIARILAGDVSPSGRLPNTIYPADFVTTRKITDMSLRDFGGITYRYYTGAPLWPFGYGLSYTSFTYSMDPHDSYQSVSVESMVAAHKRYYETLGRQPEAPVQYTVVVTNIGRVASDTVVLGFVTSTDPDAPIKELFGYARVHLNPGEDVTVHFTVPPQVLSLVDKLGNESIRPGVYKLSIGDSLETVEALLEVVGEAQNIFSLQKIRENATKRDKGTVGSFV